MARKKLPRGMVLRGETYYAKFKANGRYVHKALSPDLDVAKEMLAAERLKAYRQTEGIYDNDVQLDDLRKAWLAQQAQENRPGTVERYRQNLKNILSRLPVRTVHLLDSGCIVAYRKTRLNEGMGPRTINMEVGALKTMLTWAVREKKIGNNPIRDVAPLPHEPKDGRALERSEVDAILTNATGPYRDVWYALFTTGLRRGELAGLTFRDVDGEAREIVVRKRIGKKTKRERRIPIDDHLYAILERLRDESPFRVPGSRGGKKATEKIGERFTKDRVFVTAQNTALGHNLHREFLAACERAGIVVKVEDEEGRTVEHVSLHSTRKTFATELIRNGVDPKTVQKLLGHSTLKLTMEIYAKVHADT